VSTPARGFFSYNGEFLLIPGGPRCKPLWHKDLRGETGADFLGFLRIFAKSQKFFEPIEARLRGHRFSLIFPDSLYYS
jgi:hypothetical protein